MTFEELARLKKEMGVKAFDKARKGEAAKKAGKKVFAKVGKDSPLEITSKKPVSRFRQVIEGTAEVIFPFLSLPS